MGTGDTSSEKNTVVTEDRTQLDANGDAFWNVALLRSGINPTHGIVTSFNDKLNT